SQPNTMNELRPYLVRSGALHLFGAAFFVVMGLVIKAPVKKNFYTIDFLGGTPGGEALASTRGKPMPDAPKNPKALPSLKRWLPKARAATLHNSEMAVKAKDQQAEAPKAVREPNAMSASRK